jgi:hypothetical protein
VEQEPLKEPVVVLVRQQVLQPHSRKVP